MRRLACPPRRNDIRTEGPCRESPPWVLTGPSRKSRRRRGPATRPPSPAPGAWSSPRCRPLRRSSPALACGFRSRPAAAPSAAPARTSGGRGPGRARCQWKTWKKGAAQNTESGTPEVSGNQTLLQAEIHQLKKKKAKHLIRPPTVAQSSPVWDKQFKKKTTTGN